MRTLMPGLTLVFHFFLVFIVFNLPLYWCPMVYFVGPNDEKVSLEMHLKHPEWVLPKVAKDCPKTKQIKFGVACVTSSQDT